MVDEHDALRIADAGLARWNSHLTPNRPKDRHAASHAPALEVGATHVETHSPAWIEQFASKRWLKARSISNMVVAACPLVIERSPRTLRATTQEGAPSGR